MKLPNIFRPITSILSTKATGSIQDVSSDLAKPDGDSIANLLKADEEKNQEDETTEATDS